MKRNNPISRKQFIEKEISSFCPGATLRDFSISDLDDLSVPLEITEIFTAPDYVKAIGNNLFSFHVPTVVIDIKGTEKKDRVNSVYYHYTTAKEYDIHVKIPDGYVLDYIPEEMRLENRYASFSYTTNRDNPKEISLRIDFTRHGTEVPQEDYTEYKEFSDRIAQKLKESIVLRKL